MCTVLLPPDGYPIAVNRYISYHIISYLIGLGMSVLLSLKRLRSMQIRETLLYTVYKLVRYKFRR